MTMYAKTNQLMEIKNPKDLFINDNVIIALDNLNQIHIKDVCLIPSLLENIIKLTLKGDLLYLVAENTTITIINIVDMSIIGVYNTVNEKISDVVFGDRHIHILTESLEYYKITYENMKLRKIDDVKYCFRGKESLEELRLNKFNNVYLSENTVDGSLCLKMLSLSPRDENIIILDAYGTIYHNGNAILNITEDVKYIYTTLDRLLIVIESTLVVYNLKTRLIEEKKNIGEFKIGAGPYIVVSNTILNLLTMKKQILPIQVEYIRFLDEKVYVLSDNAIHEVVMC